MYLLRLIILRKHNHIIQIGDTSASYRQTLNFKVQGLLATRQSSGQIAISYYIEITCGLVQNIQKILLAITTTKLSVVSGSNKVVKTKAKLHLNTGNCSNQLHKWPLIHCMMLNCKFLRSNYQTTFIMNQTLSVKSVLKYYNNVLQRQVCNVKNRFEVAATAPFGLAK